MTPFSLQNRAHADTVTGLGDLYIKLSPDRSKGVTVTAQRYGDAQPATYNLTYDSTGHEWAARGVVQSCSQTKNDKTFQVTVKDANGAVIGDGPGIVVKCADTTLSTISVVPEGPASPPVRDQSTITLTCQDGGVVVMPITKNDTPYCTRPAAAASDCKANETWEAPPVTDQLDGKLVLDGACISDTIAVSTPPPGSCSDGSTPDSSGNCPGSDGDVVDCGTEGFNWLVCPAIKFALIGANMLDGFITDQLNVDVTTIFDNTDKAGSAQSGYYTAWSQFRIIATSLLVVGGLAMVASTAFGFEFLDAYTIRKTLPRLLIAIIGISLSWPLMRLVVDFFDTVGFDIRAIMYHPFQNMGGHISPATGILSSLVVGVGIFAFGPAALTFILTAFLAVFVGFVLLIIRQAAIIMLIVLAPIAIVCYVLPNTQKVWKLWFENFLGLMLVFPMYSGLIAAAHIFATVTINANPGNSPGAVTAQGVAVLAWFLAYLTLQMLFRVAYGFLGQLSGFINDKHKGAFDRLKNIRSNAAKQRHSMRMAGQTRFGSSAVGKHVYRRVGLLSTPNSGAANPFTRQGRANFNAANTTAMSRATADILKNDNGRAAGDDAAMSAAMHATSARDFIRKYQEATKRMTGTAATYEEASNALALTQSSFGTTMGSSAMQAAAFAARAGSVTGYNQSDEGKKELFEDAGSMVRRGLMTESDAMVAIKQNKARLDQSGIGFGPGLAAIRQASRNPGSISNHDVDNLMDSVMDGLTPGSFVGARKESAQAVSRHLMRRLGGAIADAGGSLNDSHVKKVMGDIAGIQDTINAQAPQMSQVFNVSLLSQPAGTSGLRVRDVIDQLRATQDSDFNDSRKEWLGSGTSPSALVGAGAGGGPSGPGGPGGPPPPSDIRLKYDISALHVTSTGIQLYRFKYLWSNQEYVGVMAQDLIQSHPEALSTDELGFYRVDYDKLGLRMMTIEEWDASHSKSSSVQ